jgi:hypothetical protein
MMGGIVGFELIDLQSGSFDDAVVYVDVVEIMTASSSILIIRIEHLTRRQDCKW